MFSSGESVTRLRGTFVADRWSSDATTRNWSDPDELEIPGCGFDPGGTNEPVLDGRSMVVTQPTVLDPSMADVLAGDRIVARGRTYEVDGDPAIYRNPFTGWAPGQVIRLKIVEG